MDTFRGTFMDGLFTDEPALYDPCEDETEREAPPSPIGQDERRMQVRAYNHWASLLGDRNFPSIEDLEPENLPDFGPYSVLLDFTGGIEDPGIAYLGRKLASECGAEDEIATLNDVPSRSLLSRITDHYMQILANQAPIGFEAEFVNHHGRVILYRGILLPFSSDDDTIDFIYGVINWKELADQSTADELLLEIDQALEDTTPAAPESAPSLLRAVSPSWGANLSAPCDDDDEYGEEEDVLDLASLRADGESESALPAPFFGTFDEAPAPLPSVDGFPAGDIAEPDSAAKDAETAPATDYHFADSSGFYEETDFEDDPAEPDPLDAEDAADLGLGDWLASARELALVARSSEDRTRATLYAAIGRAYDFSLAATEAPEQFAELVVESGLTMQDRAPMTPIVKLVFGADYDKTRLTEYASALSHAHRLGIARGRLTGFLSAAPGGLKGVVAEERRLRREECGKPARPETGLNEQLAEKLRRRMPQSFYAIPPEGEEFALVMIRRMPDRTVVVLGEIPEDSALLERAARKLLA